MQNPRMPPFTSPVAMGGPHTPDRSQRSQLQPSPMSWYTMAPRASEAMPLTLETGYAGGRLYFHISEHFLGDFHDGFMEILFEGGGGEEGREGFTRIYMIYE